MPRLRRRRGKSQTYHIMIRGNERKNLFLDDYDRLRFIDTLYEKKKEKEFELYAYCLMDNHVHLLIKEGSDELARIMKRINTSYAYYFNKKYKRIGHVFQDRYKSEIIEDEKYLLAAARYIHNNPVKAGIVKEASQYKWSSFGDYAGMKKSWGDIIDIGTMLGIFSDNEEKAKILLIEFTNQANEDIFLEYREENKHIKTITTEKEAEEYVQEFLETRGIKKADLQDRKNLSIRNDLVKELKDKSELSIRQIAGILELDRNAVQRVK